MNEVRYHQVLSPEVIDQGRQYLDGLSQSRLPRFLLAAAGGLALTATASLQLMQSEAIPVAAAAEMPAQCADVACATEVKTIVLGESVTQNAPPATEVTAPPKPEVPKLESVNPVVNERMNAMKLSPEGYNVFLQQFDMTLLSYAASKPEFNPSTNHKPQLPTKRVILHYTAFFSNASGYNTVPEGLANPLAFVDFMANRYGSVSTPNASSCCGINGFLDRNGHSYLLTPVKTRVQHNPPQDIEEFGIEVESANQEGINTAQYEQLAYYAITILKHESLIDRPLNETIMGHGEERNAYLQARPDLVGKVDKKIDFPAAESALFRNLIGQFLTNHPEIKKQQLPAIP